MSFGMTDDRAPRKAKPTPNEVRRAKFSGLNNLKKKVAGPLVDDTPNAKMPPGKAAPKSKARPAAIFPPEQSGDIDLRALAPKPLAPADATRRKAAAPPKKHPPHRS